MGSYIRIETDQGTIELDDDGVKVDGERGADSYCVQCPRKSTCGATGTVEETAQEPQVITDRRKCVARNLRQAGAHPSLTRQLGSHWVDYFERLDALVNSATPSPKQQIEELARFIQEEVPGEPSQSEGACECAIRIMRRHLEQPPGTPNTLNTNQSPSASVWMSGECVAKCDAVDWDSVKIVPVTIDPTHREQLANIWADAFMATENALTFGAAIQIANVAAQGARSILETGEIPDADTICDSALDDDWADDEDDE